LKGGGILCRNDDGFRVLASAELLQTSREEANMKAPGKREKKKPSKKLSKKLQPKAAPKPAPQPAPPPEPPAPEGSQ
jgi:hypothetical protein